MAWKSEQIEACTSIDSSEDWTDPGFGFFSSPVLLVCRCVVCLCVGDGIVLFEEELDEIDSAACGRFWNWITVDTYIPL